jgi:hypothetical protein
MEDLLGFKPVQMDQEIQVDQEEIIETPEGNEGSLEDTSSEESSSTSSEVSSEIEEGGSVETPNNITPEIQKETIDPFADLDDQSRAIFEAIKSKDFGKIKNYIDSVTIDIDSMSEYDVLKQHIKSKNPKWDEDMVEFELNETYGFGFDEDELSDRERMLYKKALLTDSEKAREALKSQIRDVQFPEIEKATGNLQTEAKPQFSEEDKAEFKKYWDGHVNTNIDGLTDEVLSIEIGSEGNKEVYEFPIAYTSEDKQNLKSLVSDFQLQDDFNARYVKDGEINVKAFAKDRFIIENAAKLIKAAFAQGHTKGQLAKLKDSKNIDYSGSPSNGTSSKDVRTTAAEFFLSNGGKRS